MQHMMQHINIKGGNEMMNFRNKTNYLLEEIIPKFVQIILNTTLAILAVFITCLLIKELVGFMELVKEDHLDYHVFLERILVFFLYFEFISMIIKYFKEDYHFPMRYFLYIGITAMIRLIIVNHSEAMETLLYSLVVLILIIGYFIMNITPRERPERVTDLFEKKEVVANDNHQ
jgi:protein PsiE